MQVKFTNNWFAPDGSLRLKNAVHDLPDHWEKQLPRRAEFVMRPAEVPPPNPPKAEAKVTKTTAAL